MMDGDNREVMSLSEPISFVIINDIQGEDIESENLQRLTDET